MSASEEIGGVMPGMPTMDPETAAAIEGLLGSDPGGYLDQKEDEYRREIDAWLALRREQRTVVLPQEEVEIASIDGRPEQAIGLARSHLARRIAKFLIGR